jgi:hypothetical protein
MRQGCPLSPFLFIRVLAFLARALRQEEEVRGLQIDKEILKISLLEDDMILHHEDQKNSTQKVLDTINGFSNVSRYKTSF